MERRTLIPIRSEPEPAESAEVQEILNWISPTFSYWTAMSNEAYLKERTLKQLLNSPEMGYVPEDSAIRTIVGTGKTLETLRLKLLEEDIGKAFITSVQEDGLTPNSEITLVIQYEPGFEGLGSLFAPNDEPELPMSSKYNSDATWYRHSCWDSQVFSKSEAWITGFLNVETEDVLSK
jgi:hypothetical protein